MGLKDDITNAMKESPSALINTRLRNIADMVNKTEDDVREKMKELDFADYVDLMRALRDQDVEAAERILGFGDMEEAYSQGSTMSPAEMRARKAGQQSPMQAEPEAGPGPTTPAAKAQAMARLGKDNLGGATAQQAADALSKAGEGKPLTPIQRKAMAQQASSVDALAADPRTATQFRNLLNKLNRK
jgi:hypothetical protein